MLWWTRRKLASRNPATRSAAALQLARGGDPDALAVLIEMLASGSLNSTQFAEQRKYAIGALGSSKDPAAVPVLLARLRETHGRDEISEIGRALSMFGDDAVEQLEKDFYRGSRAAGRALAEIGTASAIQVLVNALDDDYKHFLSGDFFPRTVREGAAVNLREIGWRSEDRKKRILCAIGAQAYGDAVSEGPDATPYLLAELNSRSAASIIAALKISANQEVLSAALQRLYVRLSEVCDELCSDALDSNFLPPNKERTIVDGLMAGISVAQDVEALRELHEKHITDHVAEGLHRALWHPKNDAEKAWHEAFKARLEVTRSRPRRPLHTALTIANPGQERSFHI